jgi:tight adherence protein B
MPFLYIYFKKKRRMEKFQRQLPDALDLVARALKAGHAFTGGLRMVAEELGDPIGTEFEKTLNEINFGVGIAEALKNIPNRVDCPDLKFFITSVIIQRETGGNLAEILTKITYLIRERFKLQNRVQVLAAEGKLSAIILIAIPFVIALALSVLNPGYIKTLFIDPIGKILVAFALIMMIIGIFVMKRMIQIKV